MEIRPENVKTIRKIGMLEQTTPKAEVVLKFGSRHIECLPNLGQPSDMKV